eukprot:PhF_6_TR42336/c0_g1_i1/m.63885
MALFCDFSNTSLPLVEFEEIELCRRSLSSSVANSFFLRCRRAVWNCSFSKMLIAIDLLLALLNDAFIMDRAPRCKSFGVFGGKAPFSLPPKTLGKKNVGSSPWLRSSSCGGLNFT